MFLCDQVDMEVFKKNWRKGAENGFFRDSGKISENLPPQRVSFFLLLEIKASSQRRIQERAKCSTQLMSPSMDRVGFLKPTCLRKIPRQATGDVTENPVEDALQTKAYSACAGYSLDPLKTRVGGNVFDQRGWGNL